MFNRSDKVKKYIILGRKSTVHNLDGDDRVKVITEIFALKPNSTDGHGGWKEYEKHYYNEIVGGSGRDVVHQEGQSFITVDGSIGDFIDFNFPDTDLETHEVRFVKTYTNKKFYSRDRSTSYHKEFDVGVDEDGNVVAKDVTKGKNAPAPAVVADFATIPAGTKYLYSRQINSDGVDHIIANDVGYWLKNDAVNDQMIQPMIDSLDIISPKWVEIEDAVIEPDGGDLDALEKVLKADPEWNEDVNFTQFCQ